MDSYINPEWKDTFKTQGLMDFETLWNLDIDPLDVPNFGRGRHGKSSVGIYKISLPDGKIRKLILKRQINYFSRTFIHPLRGIPTSQKELMNLLKLNRLGISCCRPVYYTQSPCVDGLRAILVTEHLESFIPLNAIIDSSTSGWQDDRIRQRLIYAIAKEIARMHRVHFQHNCMYPKHIFIKQDNNEVTVSFIDLEKGDWLPFSINRKVRDLGSLYKRTQGVSLFDCYRFIIAYCRAQHLDNNTKKLISAIEGYCRKKYTN